MKRKTMLSFAIGAAFALPLTAVAAGAGGVRSGFDVLDDNRDGYISRSEWMGAGMTSSSGASASQGRSASAPQAAGSAPDMVLVTITPVDVRTRAEQHREGLFRSLDTDGNGGITQSEAGNNGQVSRYFTQLDRNANGYIDRGEFNRVHVVEAPSQRGASQTAMPEGAGGTSGSGQEQSSAGGSSGAKSQSGQVDWSQTRRTPGAQPPEPTGAPAAIPDTPSSGNQPRPGPSWNPTQPQG